VAVELLVPDEHLHGGRGLVELGKLKSLAARQSEAQLEMALAQALVVRDGDMIRSSATFKQGELEVNGQPLPLFQ